MKHKYTGLALLAALVAIGASPACGAEVVSSNIVGYEKINLVAGYNMVAAQFRVVGANTLERDISTIGTLDENMAGYDDEYTYATEMRVWDPQKLGYATYGWAGTSPETIDDMPELNNTWLDPNTEATEDVIPFGASVWIVAEKAGSITFTSPLTNQGN